MVKTKRTNLSQEELLAKREKDLAKYHARRAAMTPEELDAFRKKRRDYEARTKEARAEKKRESGRRYRENNREKLRSYYGVYAKTYASRHPEKVKMYKENYNKSEKGIESKRRYLLRKCYGITLEEYNTMLDNQGHRCAACGAEEPRGVNWHVDHCHTSGKLREVLCARCNVTLGQVDDSIEVLQSLVTYLEKHRE
jgi:hypothetical protein